MPYPSCAEKLEQQAEILAECRRLNPGKRFAKSTDGAAVGVWVDDWGRFAMAYGYYITGHWVFLEGKEPLYNGVPLYKPEDWIE